MGYIKAKEDFGYRMIFNGCRIKSLGYVCLRQTDGLLSCRYEEFS